MGGAERLWADCISRLRLELPDSTWHTWLATARPRDLADHKLVLTVPSTLFKERIESRFLERLNTVLSEVAGEHHEVVVEVGVDHEGELTVLPPGPGASVDRPLDVAGAGAASATTGTGAASATTDDARARPGPGSRASEQAVIEAALARVVPDTSPPPTPGMDPDSEAHTLKPGFTFDNFVIGESNRFAHAAALAVAEQPARSWNPLFIYGDTGLGKTHLLHAIGHYVRRHYPSYNVRYVSTETFLNEFVDAIRTNAMPAFKRRFRECHVLLVDDIQFIQNKERFQEEFFYTFDSLHSAGRQIVISSDRPPRAIATLEDRLRSRFGGGLITDVQPPDFETRSAILSKKAEREPVPVPREVITYIATHITDNIRELEGALLRIAAYSSLNRVPISVEVAEAVLADVVGKEIRQITPKLILETTAEVFGFSVEDLISKSRSRPLVQARQISMYVFRELTDFSYPAIGRVFGDRDHTTVMHAVEKISGLMKERRAIFEQVSSLIQRLRTGA